MGDVVDLRESRLRRIAHLAFRGWDKKFNETFSHTTTLASAGHNVIRFFASGTPQSMQILQAFVARCRYYRQIKNSGYENLDVTAKKEIVDISLFLLDQTRFEAMFRLGWISDFPARTIPLVELVVDFYEEYEWLQYETPSLQPTHDLYPDYIQTYEPDRNSFVRRLIPHVLQMFNQFVGIPPTHDDNRYFDH
ncbi:MAG: hypothetical protein ACP5TY_04750 [Thermodesulforhabdaceae bacterium]